MKNKTKYFLKKNHLTVLLITCVLILNFIVSNQRKQISHWKNQFSESQTVIKQLQDSQNVMVWTMDSSCFKQIKNSADGILRLKINK